VKSNNQQRIGWWVDDRDAGAWNIAFRRMFCLNNQTGHRIDDQNRPAAGPCCC
jgi:hypothetical protein